MQVPPPPFLYLFLIQGKLLQNSASARLKLISVCEENLAYILSPFGHVLGKCP